VCRWTFHRRRLGGGIYARPGPTTGGGIPCPNPVAARSPAGPASPQCCTSSPGHRVRWGAPGREATGPRNAAELARDRVSPDPDEASATEAGPPPLDMIRNTCGCYRFVLAKPKSRSSSSWQDPAQETSATRHALHSNPRRSGRGQPDPRPIRRSNKSFKLHHSTSAHESAGTCWKVRPCYEAPA